MSRATAARALVAATAALVATLGATAPASAGSGPSTATSVRGTVRVIVTYDSIANTRSVAGSVDAMGTVTRTMRHSAHLVATVPASGLARLRTSPHVRSVQVDVPQKPTLDSTTHVIHADRAHSYGVTGAGTTVAILDTGVDVDHPFLAGRVVAQFCSSTPSDSSQVSLCPNHLTTDDNANIDSLPACASGLTTLCDHGTHVAGIAAGNGSGVLGAQAQAGVAPGANIIAMQVFTRFNSTSLCGAAGSCVASWTSDQLNALDELADLDTAHPAWNIVAANLSLGGGKSSTPCDDNPLKSAIDYLLGQGVATVIAAGNDGFDAAVSAPGCISSAVTVGATNDNDTIASYSNRGALLDVFAPGSSVTSSVPDDKWATYSGTSMATPHVVGTLALLRQVYPARSIAQLVQDLRDTGTGIPYPSDGLSISTPRIDVMAAVDSIPHAPLVALTAFPVTTPEGGTASVSGTWHQTAGTAVTVTASTGSLTQGADTWSWTASRGDDSTVPVTITAADASNASRSVGFTAQWSNVAPTVHLGAAASTWRGAQLATAGTLTTFTLQVTDPGSDDVSATWSHGDGASAFARSLVAPPTADPAPSPSDDPRSVTLALRHTYTIPCARTLSVSAFDDDHGRSPTATRAVVVLGTSASRRSAAWWTSEYRGLHSGLSAAERTCLLSVARTMSTVFAEKRRLTTGTDAVAALRPATPTSAQTRLDAQLLAVWLDVAIGSVHLADPLDADGNGSTETTVGAFLTSTEAKRNSVSATSSALPPLTTVLTRISTTG